MPRPDQPEPSEAVPPAADPEEAVMARNGITRTPANVYHVDGYRYGNLGDAMDQVRRVARRAGMAT